MEKTSIAKELINYQKSVIEKAFDAVGLFQEQTEQIAKAWMEQNTGITVQSRNLLQQWAKLFNKTNENYKEIIDDQLNKFEVFFTKTSPAMPMKPAKTEPKAEPKTETRTEIKAEAKTEVKTNGEERKKQAATKK